MTKATGRAVKNPLPVSARPNPANYANETSTARSALSSLMRTNHQNPARLMLAGLGRTHSVQYALTRGSSIHCLNLRIVLRAACSSDRDVLRTTFSWYHARRMERASRVTEQGRLMKMSGNHKLGTRKCTWLTSFRKCEFRSSRSRSSNSAAHTARIERFMPWTQGKGQQSR